MRTAVLVPAYNAEAVVAPVVRALRVGCDKQGWANNCLMLIDDGSTDATAMRAREAGAEVLVHRHNRGKGAALLTGLLAAQHRGFDVALTVDADGQHPADEAIRMATRCEDGEALVLGIRDLAAADAPTANRWSNRFSNRVLSAFCRRQLADTQCGLRRYPVQATLDLGCKATGYDFESEVLLRASASGMRTVQTPINVIYPTDRLSHFDNVKDPARIVATVLRTVAQLRWEERRA